MGLKLGLWHYAKNTGLGCPELDAEIDAWGLLGHSNRTLEKTAMWEAS